MSTYASRATQTTRAKGSPVESPEMDEHQRFLLLFLKHQHDLRAFVASMIRDWHRSEDVVQEVSMILWEKFATYDDHYSFGAWARGIASNMILKDIGRYRRALPLLSPDSIASLLEAYEVSEKSDANLEQEALRRCTQELGGRAKQLLALRYEQAMNIEQAAAQIGSSVAAVKKALTRIRAQLRECVGRRLASANAANLGGGLPR